MNFWKAIAILWLTFVVGCANIDNLNSAKSRQKVVKTNIIVSTAASLKEVMEEIEPLYEQEHPNVTITYNFAASGTLQKQIERGAPVDVLISADRSLIDLLLEKNLLQKETVRDLLHNQMVLIAPKNSNLKLTSFTDLINPEIEIIALAEQKSVPAGKYAQEVLNYFKITEQVQRKAVYGKDVRQVLNYVVTGNADVGIVYLTDALIAQKVKIVEIAPDYSHSTIVYGISAIAESQHPAIAQEFIQFLETKKIQNIFIRYGFIPIQNNQQIGF